MYCDAEKSFLGATGVQGLEGIGMVWPVTGVVAELKLVWSQLAVGDGAVGSRARPGLGHAGKARKQ